MLTYADVWQAFVVHFFPCEWIPLGAWAGAIDDVSLVVPQLQIFRYSSDILVP
jgi:hypothetical protein